MDATKPEMKRCSRCRRILDIGNFHCDKTKPDGLYTVCKECRKGVTSRPEIPNGYRLCKRCETAKPETEFYKASDGHKRRTCKSCCEERWTKSYKVQTGRFPSHMRQSLLSYISATDRRALDRSNPLKRANDRRADAKYRKSERGSLKTRAWWQTNYAMRAIYLQRRKARVAGLPCEFSAEDWQKTRDTFDNRCAYCGLVVSKYDQDHFIPVSKGGPYVLGNMVPACHSCNTKKKDRLPSVFCGMIKATQIAKKLDSLGNGRPTHAL